MEGWTITRDSLNNMVRMIKTHHLWNDGLQGVFESLTDQHHEQDSFPLADLLVELARKKHAVWLYKQMVWQIGSLCDKYLNMTLIGADGPNIGGSSKLVTVDSQDAHQRKLMLVKYMRAMRRANSESLNHTCVIDAGRTKSRQKRDYMAVGTPKNVLGWTAPQVQVGDSLDFCFLFLLSH